MKKIKSKVIYLLIIFLVFLSFANVINRKVVYADNSEYIYMTATVKESTRVVGANDQILMGYLEPGQEIRVYCEKTSDNPKDNLGWYMDINYDQYNRIGITYLYKLTQSYTLDNGITAHAGDYVETMYIEVIGEDEKEIKDDEGENAPTPEVETIDEILEKEWDEIPPNIWQGGGGVNSMDHVKKLYEKLMAVDYENLPDDKKEYFLECSGNLKYTITSSYSTGETDGWVKNLNDKEAGDKPIYTNPLFGQTGQTAENVTPDKIIGDAETFVQDGQNSSVATINQTNADTALNSIYNILLAIAISITVIWGLVIAIKLMMSSVEEKAEYKQMLWPYLIGCIVIFGSFIIWRIIIIVMNNVL